MDHAIAVAGVIKKFHPTELLCYGVALMTGAWMITRFKIDAGVNYFMEYGKPLGFKLILVFILMMVACGKFFGLGTGIVYLVEEGGSSPESQAEISRKLKVLMILSWTTIAFLLITIYMGLYLARP